MGISEYLWPFQKKFSEIPCAREAGIASLLGGVGLGAASIIITNKTKYAYKTSIYSGFVIFWIAFINCRIQLRKTERASQEFLEAIKSGKIDT